MSQNIISQQLRSDDPKQRFQAVKQAARTKDTSVLDLLIKLADSDPDEQVRSVAARAQAYIQGDQTVLETPAPSASKASGKAASGRVDESLAKSLLDNALSLQIQGQRNKALKALSKALNSNPGLRTDPYFISILEATTRLEGAEAFEMLFDSESIKHVEVSEKQMAKEKRAGDHWSEVNKSNWASASMDLMIYMLISIIGTVLLVLIVQQSAENVFAGYDAALAAYNEEVAAGDNTAQRPIRNSALESVAREYRSLEMTLGLMGGVVVGVISLLQVLVHLGVAHLLAKYLFKGDGTLPHLIYNVVSLYNTRMPVIFFLTYIAIMTTFSGDLGVVPMLLLGASGIVSLLVLFGVFARTAKTYDFGMVKGLLVTFIALIPSSFVPTLIWMVVGPLLSPMIPPSLL